MAAIPAGKDLRDDQTRTSRWAGVCGNSFRVSELRARGLSRAAVRWGAKSGRWRRVEKGIYAEGPDEPTNSDRARAALMVTRGVASGTMAGALLGLDGVQFTRADLTLRTSQGHRRAGARNRPLPPSRVVEVHGIQCTDALQTLVDLAAELSDLQWEDALESALRTRLVDLDALTDAATGAQRGSRRMRRVLAMRPAGAPPTESLLETKMVQLARSVAGLEPPQRQVSVFAAGAFVARVDLAWPRIGLFVELDGQHHRGQPLYDARRETAIVAATGWLCGRFTWHEVVDLPFVTARRLTDLVAQARLRPLREANRPAPEADEAS